MLDIYETSIDYDAKAETTTRFFKVVQNKMNWAAHGRTAAELVYERADATKPNMGLTSWAGSVPRKRDIDIAKNYLSADELEALNRIVTAYLEFAELQARGRRPMRMTDWITKLDEYLRLADRAVLDHAGSLSHDVAAAKADLEYARLDAARRDLPTKIEAAFEAFVEQANAIADTRARKPTKKPKR